MNVCEWYLIDEVFISLSQKREMKDIKYYILKILETEHHCAWNESEIDFKNIVRTQGNIGYYVKYDVVDHFTGYLAYSKDYQFISNMGFYLWFL